MASTTKVIMGFVISSRHSEELSSSLMRFLESYTSGTSRTPVRWTSAVLELAAWHSGLARVASSVQFSLLVTYRHWLWVNFCWSPRSDWATNLYTCAATALVSNKWHPYHILFLQNAPPVSLIHSLTVSRLVVITTQDYQRKFPASIAILVPMVWMVLKSATGKQSSKFLQEPSLWILNVLRWTKQGLSIPLDPPVLSCSDSSMWLLAQCGNLATWSSTGTSSSTFALLLQLIPGRRILKLAFQVTQWVGHILEWLPPPFLRMPWYRSCALIWRGRIAATKGRSSLCYSACCRIHYRRGSVCKHEPAHRLVDFGMFCEVQTSPQETVVSSVLLRQENVGEHCLPTKATAGVSSEPQQYVKYRLHS